MSSQPPDPWSLPAVTAHAPAPDIATSCPPDFPPDSCPRWCRLRGVEQHRWADNQQPDGRLFRDHERLFGATGNVTGWASEYADQPGRLRYGVTIHDFGDPVAEPPATPAELRELAASLLEAADWLAAHQ